jgi:hypothetical protein
MNDKKQENSSEKEMYSAEEVAQALIDKTKTLIGNVLEKSELKKTNPMNQTYAQVAELGVKQDKPPKADTKIIARQPLQLKKFMEKCDEKRMNKKEGK